MFADSKSSDTTTVRMVWELRLVYDSIVKPVCNLDAILWSFNAAEEVLNTYKSKRKQEPHAGPYVTHTLTALLLLVEMYLL